MGIGIAVPIGTVVGTRKRNRRTMMNELIYLGQLVIFGYGTVFIGLELRKILGFSPLSFRLAINIRTISIMVAAIVLGLSRSTTVTDFVFLASLMSEVFYKNREGES
jgi:urea transporter